MTSRIAIEFEGTFASRQEAAAALEDAAFTVRAGKWIASQPLNANPTLFITEDSAGSVDAIAAKVAAQ